MNKKKFANVFLEPSFCPNVSKPDEQETKYLQNSHCFLSCVSNAIVDADDLRAFKFSRHTDTLECSA